VAAHVQERAQFTARVAHDDDRFGSEVDQEIIAGAGHAACVACAEPMPEEHALHVAFEDGGIRIEIPGQRAARLVIIDERR
jgi:hypothetical protein